MRQHANRIETKLIAREGQQLFGQSLAILRMWEKYDAATSRSYVNNIHAKQRSGQKALQFYKLPSKKRNRPSRKKITTQENNLSEATEGIQRRAFRIMYSDVSYQAA